jgi:peptidyl-prolyl cis-trans isomerase B (cyclophilin B)
MSLRNQGPSNRRARRQNLGAPAQEGFSSLDALPGPLKILGNRKLFFALTAVAGFVLVASMFIRAAGPGTKSNDGGPQQGNEAADAPVNGTADPSQGTPAPSSSPTSTVKRYDTAPAMTIDPSKTYTATIATDKGNVEIALDPAVAPQAVNAFVFLANEGYYNGTEFMELVKAADGSKFYTQTGDPTETGLGTPGFSVPKEVTAARFERGAVGMGGSSENSNGGQFFISFGNFPALDGKYTIFGHVTSGLDVLDSLSLLNLTSDGERTQGDTIQSVTIEES